jgi:hypothetical protein
MSRRNVNAVGYSVDLDNGNVSVQRATINTSSKGDYGCDPMPDGTFRMVPSGDIVTFEERCRRLSR